MRTWLAVLALALAGGCGDNLAAPPDAAVIPRLAIVGHSDLGARGMNSALAVAGDTVYVGSRTENQPVLIVDVADPRAPEVVGQIGLPDEGHPGLSSRELRAIADLDLLVVLDLYCSPDLHGCGPLAPEPEGLRIYDIRDRRAPRLLARHVIAGDLRTRRSPHEFFLWRDPADPARVLAYVSTPPGSDSLEVVDLTVPSAPRQVLTWDVIDDGGLNAFGSDNILHSIGVSDDGRTGYASHQQGGLVLLDLGDVVDRREPATIRMLTPPEAALDWSPPGAMGPHSTVLVPGRPLAVVTEEVYPVPFSRGCPWGHVRVVDIARADALAVLGEYRLPENDPAYCESGAPVERIAFTAHNASATSHLASVSWYAGGLQVIDLTDPARPTQIVELRPQPLPAVEMEDPGLGGSPVSMWGYPIIQDGLIYVTDSRNGLYVLRYQGPYQDEVAGEPFLEGNSNL
jgi:hypothetical protein